MNRNIILVILVILTAVVVGINAATDDTALGKPQSMKIDQTTTCNDVDTDMLTTGYIGSETFTADVIPAKIGTLTTGTKIVEIFALGQINIGGATLKTATTTVTYLATDSRTLFHVSTTTPAIYLGCRTGATQTAIINHLK